MPFLLFCPFLLLIPRTILAFSSTLSGVNNCPGEHKFGSGPPLDCFGPTDPNNRPPSELEEWFTSAMFYDLFPYANLGWGPHRCSPYSYESFIIAARYFPRFGTESPLGNGLTAKENTRRDVATFLAHAIQETGLNDISLYQQQSGGLNQSQADDCFYRGGLFNWFEGGPMSAFLDPSRPGYKPSDGEKCLPNGRYCSPSSFHECGNSSDGIYFDSCYFGRGAIQISYNYNYGQFGEWLRLQNIAVDLLAHPNSIMTHMDPPLALLASLWFYMTPQPPKPAMHDIILGQWHAGPENEVSGYYGPIFGPTSLVINNECTGEDPKPPGSGGENRRIRAFKWFCKYFGVPVGQNETTTLSCKMMPKRFDQIPQNVSWEPEWSTTWRADQRCRCAPAAYGGPIPFYQAGYFPEHFVEQNEGNGKKCQQMLYKYPSAFGLYLNTSACLNFTGHDGGSSSSNISEPLLSLASTTIANRIPNAITQTIKTPGARESVKEKENEGQKPLMKRVASALGRGSTNYLHPDIAALLG